MSQTGMDVLRTVLKRMRWDDQHGYPCYMGDGKWSFVSTGLPQVTPEELNTLFEFAGIVPDKIESLGTCRDCKFAIVHQEGGKTASERGYSNPCSPCKRPRMSNFEPVVDPNAKCAKCGEVRRFKWHAEGYVDFRHKFVEG